MTITGAAVENEKCETLTIRSATRADLFAVQNLVEELYSEDANCRHANPSIFLTYQEFKKRPDKGTLVVFDAGDDLAGYAILIFFWSNEYRSNLIEIDELFVKNQFRGQGLGQAFFQWLETEFPNEAGLTLQVAHANPRAKQLYEKLGFSVSRNIHMIKCFESAKDGLETTPKPES